MKRYKVYSITFNSVEFYGTKKECQQFIKEQKQAEQDLNLPQNEQLKIEEEL